MTLLLLTVLARLLRLPLPGLIVRRVTTGMALAGLWAAGGGPGIGQPGLMPKPVYHTGLQRQQAWVDSVYAALTPRQRIGQLFMVAAYSNRDAAHEAELTRLITEQHIGGLIFFQGGPLRQARLTNRLQAQAAVPLMIGIDGEWGLQMRLKDSTLPYPRQMTLGAHPDEALIYRMGRDMARQMRRIGVHVNFAPVVDINVNPRNPVIGMRAFGEQPENVTLKAGAYMRGLQHGGVLACAKHFPGHGDTDQDSHMSLPTVRRSREQLSEQDFEPYRRLIADSLGSVMVGHLYVPALDKTPNRPSTLSKPIVTDLLRRQMRFEGLIFTDALNMRGATLAAPPGELEVAALRAGNDVLLFPEDVPRAVRSIEQALAKRTLRPNELEVRVRRILAAKWWAGLHRRDTIATQGLNEALHQPGTQALINDCYRAAVTIVRDPKGMVPVGVIDTTRFASIAIGTEGTGRTPLQDQLSDYAPFEHFQLAEDDNRTQTTQALALIDARLRGPHTVVVSLHKLGGKSPRSLSAPVLEWLERLSRKHQVIIAHLGNPYLMTRLPAGPAIVCVYEEAPAAQRALAQALFGAGATGGRLPISLSGVTGGMGATRPANGARPAAPPSGSGDTDILSDDLPPEGGGRFTPSAQRLGYGLPEQAGLSSLALARIDSLAQQIIREGMTPGCQVVVARRGMIVYRRSFGHMIYPAGADSTLRAAAGPVTDNTLYDIASITKVAATLQAVMFLTDRGQLDITQPLSTYLPELVGTNKANLIVADVLAHQAGLVPYVPFYKQTIRTPALVERNFAASPDAERFTEPVSRRIYTQAAMADSVWQWLVRTPLNAPRRDGGYDYKYSDLGFIILKRIADRLLGQPMETFLQENFYRPMGLQTLGYRPLARFDSSQIAPTERDRTFRGELIRGTVHDPTAALLGGVAGHAGLFSTATDLAILMQMNLQDGVYGGCRYLSPGTVGYFARPHFARRNRRGLGWDRPMPPGQDGPTSPRASFGTFGHTGFTGTCVWADPAQELVFVFLANRVYPDPDNNRLVTASIRPRMHDLVYRALLPSPSL